MTGSYNENNNYNNEQLPHGWVKVIDPNSGRPYYACAATGESSWTAPGLSTYDVRRQHPQPVPEIPKSYQQSNASQVQQSSHATYINSGTNGPNHSQYGYDTEYNRKQNQLYPNELNPSIAPQFHSQQQQQQQRQQLNYQQHQPLHRPIQQQSPTEYTRPLHYPLHPLPTPDQSTTIPNLTYPFASSSQNIHVQNQPGEEIIYKDSTNQRPSTNTSQQQTFPLYGNQSKIISSNISILASVNPVVVAGSAHNSFSATSSNSTCTELLLVSQARTLVDQLGELDSIQKEQQQDSNIPTEQQNLSDPSITVMTKAELSAFTSGQIADLCSIHLQQFVQQKEHEEDETNHNKTTNEYNNDTRNPYYVPIDPYQLEIHARRDFMEPGRIETRLHSLYNKLKNIT
jgi:WW domain